MRAFALMLFLASGCSLYFASNQQPDPGHPSPGGIPPDARIPVPDAPIPPDAYQPPPDAPQPPSGGLMARCEDGQLRVTSADTFAEQGDHGVGRLIGQCSGSCRSAAVFCTTADCSDAGPTLCGAPASVGATCPLEGSACVGSEVIDCPETTTCGVAVLGSSCGCVNGTYRCTQQTPAAATQAGIVGKWRGTVTTPGFTAPYPITLWIYPDGTYWPDCALDHCSAFYYGGDGPAPDRKITILSTSAGTGAWANIAIDFGLKSVDMGALSGLVVDATSLRFTFFASWFGCGQPFDFNLTRY